MLTVEVKQRQQNPQCTDVGNAFGCPGLQPSRTQNRITSSYLFVFALNLIMTVEERNVISSGTLRLVRSYRRILAYGTLIDLTI